MTAAHRGLNDYAAPEGAGAASFVWRQRQDSNLSFHPWMCEPVVTLTLPYV
jgi:hypothetical protein